MKRMSEETVKTADHWPKIVVVAMTAGQTGTEWRITSKDGRDGGDLYKGKRKERRRKCQKLVSRVK